MRTETSEVFCLLPLEETAINKDAGELPSDLSCREICCLKMVNSPSYTSKWPMILNCLCMALVVTSLACYILMDRRAIMNTIERMEMNDRERDAKILGNERRIHDLDSKLQQCKLGRKHLPEFRIHDGELSLITLFYLGLCTVHTA